MNKAIFLDRDGTINQDVGHLYQKKKLVLIPGAIKALKILQEKFLLFIVTNQSGISKGAFSEEEFRKFNNYFIELFARQDINIKETFYCPHTKEEKCICHKPSLYFIEEAKKTYNIDICDSYCIGDHPHDVEMAYNIGMHSIFVLTGHGTKHKKELLRQPDYIARDLYEAALWITTNNF
jgi:histidinol-phosphate phosphatase family protein